MEFVVKGLDVGQIMTAGIQFQGCKVGTSLFTK